jgi:hypothetical protein
MFFIVNVESFSQAGRRRFDPGLPLQLSQVNQITYGNAAHRCRGAFCFWVPPGCRFSCTFGIVLDRDVVIKEALSPIKPLAVSDNFIKGFNPLREGDDYWG